MQEDILIPLIIFSAIFGVLYVYLTTRNKERLALIEKGADASLFHSGKKRSMGAIIMNLALLSVGIGLGVLVGEALHLAGMNDDVSFPASIFIFAGLGLIASYFVNRKFEGD